MLLNTYKKILRYLRDVTLPLRCYYSYRLRRRKWTTTKQVAWIRETIKEDSRWLSHDPTAAALCERYLSMLVEEWELVPISTSSDVRDELQKKPNYNIPWKK